MRFPGFIIISSSNWVTKRVFGIAKEPITLEVIGSFAGRGDWI